MRVKWGGELVTGVPCGGVQGRDKGAGVSRITHSAGEKLLSLDQNCFCPGQLQFIVDFDMAYKEKPNSIMAYSELKKMKKNFTKPIFNLYHKFCFSLEKYLL